MRSIGILNLMIRSAGDIQTAAHIILALGIDGLAACKILEHEAMSVLLE
jgi:hypothetical protein